jgi:hypothetical protein
MSNGEYEVDMKKLMEMSMCIEFNYTKESNIDVAKKVNKRFTLTKSLSKNFYYLVDALYRKF